MMRVKCARFFHAILNMHGNAWRAGFGPPFRFLNFRILDLIWRQSFCFVDESLILCRFAFLRGSVAWFGDGQIFPANPACHSTSLFKSAFQ